MSEKYLYAILQRICLKLGNYRRKTKIIKAAITLFGMSDFAMAFKRSAVRSRLSPPNSTNPNLMPVGEGFGFVVFFEYPNFNAKF